MLPDDAQAIGRLSHEKPFLLKIHGDAGASRFVLSSADYARLESNEALMRTLYAVYQSRVVVFLGYGLSDRDILQPLQLLARDAATSGKRHVALLPAGLDRRDRTYLEDNAGVNVVEYSSAARGHEPVFESVVDWFLGRQGPGPGMIHQDPADYAALLRSYPAALAGAQREAVESSLAYLQSLRSKWGPRPTDTIRAANIAEGLLALGATRLAFRHGAKPAEQVADLLAFQADAGNFISATLRRSNIQTHALAMCALSAWEELDQRIPEALDRAAGWLLSVLPAEQPGWGRFIGDGIPRLGPTLWSLAALGGLDRLPAGVWRRLRGTLLQDRSVGYEVGDRVASHANAGWLLWFLALLRASAGLDAQDVRLVRLAIDQISDPRSTMRSEIEMFPVAGATADLGWQPWLHPTAAAVTMGLLPWLEEFPDCWAPLGRSVAALLAQWDAGGRTGYLQDPGPQHSAGERFLVSTFYGTWALGLTVQQFGGVVIEKSGLAWVRDGRLMLLRKKGTNSLILPGGSIEPGESPVVALRRELCEELGIEAAGLRSWGKIKDRAAFERGVAVEIDVYVADRIEGVPAARAEIGEIVWFDVIDDDPGRLSPVIANQLVPRLRVELR